jgi:cell wall-associated NlpC family hydrolase
MVNALDRAAHGSDSRGAGPFTPWSSHAAPQPVLARCPSDVPTAPRVPVTTPRGGGAEYFVQAALAQAGDRYVFGQEARLDDPNPTAFDCSELVQWAAHQAGVDVPDGSWLQYQQLQQQGGAMSVEQALHTRGALLFSFSSSPTGSGRPSTAHVAISLGDGRTIEARNSRDGVGVFTASTQRFNYAAVIPGLSGVPSGGSAGGLGMYPSLAPDAGSDPFGMPGAAMPSAVLGGPGQTDSDGDGLTDRFEALLHTDPNRADTDGDGIGDTAETATYHSDPLRADTDGDGITDAAEIAAGTDPGRAAVPQEAVDAHFGGVQALDTDHDGLTDTFEQQMGTLAPASDDPAGGLHAALPFVADPTFH